MNLICKYLTGNCFVYGSLRQGMRNFGVMENAGGKFIATARTNDVFYMTGLTSKAYPYLTEVPLLHEQQPKQITGEIFSVTDEGLARLDELEGHPDFYRRELREVTCDGTGEIITCNIYLLRDNDTIQNAIADKRSRFEDVPSGDWCLHGGCTLEG